MTFRIVMKMVSMMKYLRFVFELVTVTHQTKYACMHGRDIIKLSVYEQ